MCLHCFKLIYNILSFVSSTSQYFHSSLFVAYRCEKATTLKQRAKSHPVHHNQHARTSHFPHRPRFLTSCGSRRTRPSSPPPSSALWRRRRADRAGPRGGCGRGCRSLTVRILHSPSSGPSDAVCSCSARCPTSASARHGLPAKPPPSRPWNQSSQRALETTEWATH